MTRYRDTMTQYRDMSLWINTRLTCFCRGRRGRNARRGLVTQRSEGLCHSTRRMQLLRELSQTLSGLQATRSVPVLGACHETRRDYASAEKFRNKAYMGICHAYLTPENTTKGYCRRRLKAALTDCTARSKRAMFSWVP